MINNLSYLHPWEIIIYNYNTLGKTIPNHQWWIQQKNHLVEIDYLLLLLILLLLLLLLSIIIIIIIIIVLPSSFLLFLLSSPSLLPKLSILFFLYWFTTF